MVKKVNEDPYSMKDDWMGLIPYVALIYMGADSRRYRDPRRYRSVPAHEEDITKEVPQTTFSTPHINST
jgi:hypothetical protein